MNYFCVIRHIIMGNINLITTSQHMPNLRSTTQRKIELTKHRKGSARRQEEYRGGVNRAKLCITPNYRGYLELGKIRNTI